MQQLNIQFLQGFKPQHIIELLQLLQEKKITPLKAKDILRKFIPKSFSPKKEKIKVVTDKKKLTKTIQEIISKNKKTAEDYKSGNKKAINFLMGEVMKQTKKQADYKTVLDILKKELK